MLDFVITVGAPASGKTTWAKAWQLDRPAVRRNVNRDDLRASFGTRFQDGDENIVARIRDSAAREYLAAGFSVCVSDTNIDSKARTSLINRISPSTFDARVVIVDFRSVNVDTCLNFNKNPNRNPVPDHVIRRFFAQATDPSRQTDLPPAPNAWAAPYTYDEHLPLKWEDLA